MLPRLLTIVCLSVAALWTLATASAAETELIDKRTPWRAQFVQGPAITKTEGGLKVESKQRRQFNSLDPATAEPEKLGFSQLPATDWHAADFDDRAWHRYLIDDLNDSLSDYGVHVGDRPWPTLLCLRSCFGIDDPAKAVDVKLTLTYLGGAVVYVNGQEVGRATMPAEKVFPLTPATDYPFEAYVAADGESPLPALVKQATPDAESLPRYQKRVRSATIAVPAAVLKKGRNVLAIELHRAAAAGPLPRNGGWSHLGLHDIALTSRGGTGVIAYDKAISGTRVWSAAAEQQVTAETSQQSLLRRSMFKTLIWARGMPVKGVQFGNPYDPVLPVRMAAPRNGTCSGQAVVSDPSGVRALKATVDALRSPQGATLPGQAVAVRYAVQEPHVHYCDALRVQPPQDAKTVPVWLVIDVPKAQPAGWYAGALKIEANGKSFSVPVQLLVTGAVLPPSRDFTSNIGIASSADTIAAHYDVKPWSDEHFKLMEPSLAMLGQLGNDVLQVPVVTRNQFNWRLTPVRFVKTDKGLKPDLTILRRYLDLYEKHCAPPKALVLYIWDRAFAREVANSYEGRQLDVDRTIVAKQPLMVEVIDPATGDVAECPAPHISDPEGEAFYTALLAGVRDIVTQRRWPTNCIMVGVGGDIRPSKDLGARMRQWAPYARWNLLSHFSGDPGSGFYKGPNREALAQGKLIAIGDLEVGLKEHPYPRICLPSSMAELERRLEKPTEYLDLPTVRWHWQDYSPPLSFRTLALQWGNVGRLGLDFWRKGQDAPRNVSYFTASSILAVPGAAGAEPTVRFQMLREGVQDMELRWSIVRACQKLPEEERAPYRAVVDDILRRWALGRDYLSQNELSLDWPAYAAAVQEAAATLAGVKPTATWQQPPR